MKSGVTDFLIETAGSCFTAGSTAGVPMPFRAAWMSPISFGNSPTGTGLFDTYAATMSAVIDTGIQFVALLQSSGHIISLFCLG